MGLDVLAHVVRNIYENAPNDESREIYRVPPLHGGNDQARLAGRKDRQRLLQDGKEGRRIEILTLDWQKMEYRPRQKAKFGSIEAGKAIEDTRERSASLLAPGLEGKGGDKANQFLWATA